MVCNAGPIFSIGPNLMLYILYLIHLRQIMRVYMDSRYLKKTYFIDFDHPSIYSLANSITSDADSDQDKAVRLFYAVRDRIKYNPFVSAYIRDTNKASRVIGHGQGYCVQKAIVLIALARCVGIPSRLGLADIVNHLLDGPLLDAMGTNLFTCHGYAELYLGERWVKATPTFDIGMCKRKSLIPVEFDGYHDALLPPTDMQGSKYIEYITYHGFFDDLPFDFIMKKWEEHYPGFKGIMQGE